MKKRHLIILTFLLFLNIQNVNGEEIILNKKNFNNNVKNNIYNNEKTNKIILIDDITDPNNHSSNIYENSGKEDYRESYLPNNDKNNDKNKDKNKDNNSTEKSDTANGDLIKKDNKIEFATCKSLFSGDGGADLLNLLKTGVTLLRISIPLLLLALGIMDFSKAVFASSEDDMKKAQKKFTKRLIIGICVFLIPSLLKLILTVGSTVWGDIISNDFCGIL